MNDKMKKLFAHLVTVAADNAQDTFYDALWAAGEILDIEWSEAEHEDDRYDENLSACDSAFIEAFEEFFGISWREAEEYRI